MKFAIKQEQSDARINFAERERTRCVTSKSKQSSALKKQTRQLENQRLPGINDAKI
jgi:hypothetical protein